MRLLTLLAVLAAPTIASAEEIVPMDGTWTVTPRETSVGEGCPAEMVAALDGMAQQMQQASSFDVVWNGDFDPRRPRSRAATTAWNGPRSTPDVERRDEGLARGPDARTLRMHITEPGKIESTTTIAVGPMMAAQGQQVAELETCELELVSDMAHAG